MHSHIIRLYEVIETPADIYVEYVKAGELFDYTVEKGDYMRKETDPHLHGWLSTASWP